MPLVGSWALSLSHIVTKYQYFYEQKLTLSKNLDCMAKISKKGQNRPYLSSRFYSNERHAVTKIYLRNNSISFQYFLQALL